MKYASALVSPNDITVNSYNPYLVLNAVFGISDGPWLGRMELGESFENLPTYSGVEVVVDCCCVEDSRQLEPWQS